MLIKKLNFTVVSLSEREGERKKESGSGNKLRFMWTFEAVTLCEKIKWNGNAYVWKKAGEWNNWVHKINTKSIRCHSSLSLTTKISHSIPAITLRKKIIYCSA